MHKLVKPPGNGTKADYTITHALRRGAYADLWDPITNKYFVAEEDIKRKLEEKKFSETQATDLLSQWSVKSHQKNTESGFSATLFQSTAGGSNYVLAIRGTEPTRNQIIPDLGYADVGDIVRDGLAMDQVVDMYNYWQQLIAPKGQLYEVAVLETDLNTKGSELNI